MNKMTQIKHHLTNQLLIGYSAGTLPEAFSLVVATHLSMCDICRAAAEAFDAIGGSILDLEIQAPLEDDAFNGTLTMISKGSIASKAAVVSDVPTPLSAYIGGDLRDVKWHSVGMGVRQSVFKTSKSATARLLYIPAGSTVPDHGHRGTELTLVLQGAFRDETALFAAGDVEVANEDLNHTPVAEIGEDCICLAATDAPLRFNAWIPRIAQPFLRI